MSWSRTEWSLYVERPALMYEGGKAPKVPKTVSKIVLRWVIDVLLVAQFAMGTILMSSVIFVRIQDATLIVLRYLASAAVVRLIVAFEKAGMKYARTKVISRGEGYMISGYKPPHILDVEKNGSLRASSEIHPRLERQEKSTWLNYCQTHFTSNYPTHSHSTTHPPNPPPSHYSNLQTPNAYSLSSPRPHPALTPAHFLHIH